MKIRVAAHRCVWVAFLSGCFLFSPFAAAQTLLVDEFDGTHGNAAFHPGGVVDVSTYRVPFGGTNGDDFVGRTNFRFTLPKDGVATAAAGSTDGKVAVLTLDTYNPGAPGSTFLGSDVITKRNFGRGGGISMTTRMRVAGPIPGGLVAAPFLYDTTRENPPGTLVRDEIDHEILTNNAQSAAPDNTLTNVWNDGNFASGGSPVMISNPSGFDVTQFHDYRTDWTPSSVKYYIDGNLVRTETSVIPDDPMRAHVNFWAPDNTFAAAYNASLAPVSTGPGTTYKVEVDRMQIDRINTTVSNNLLADGSFEDFSVPAANGTGGWTLFNNASLSSEYAAQDGFAALKVFGPFHGNVDASGAFQNVPAAPGEQFEGSVWAYSPSGDSILGQNNYTNITLSFVNSAGAVIGSVNYSPGTNEKNTPIFDGRDTNMPQNNWVQYTVNAIAPAGTAYVRESLFFIQLNNQGGAVFFDSASLVKLTANAPPVLGGDYNHNGVVDAADYVVWRDTAGQTGTGLAADGNGDNVVDANDYNYWRARFGNTAGSGSLAGAAVPEGGASALMLLSLLIINSLRRRG